jgi:hypothetical protein
LIAVGQSAPESACTPDAFALPTDVTPIVEPILVTAKARAR